MTLFYQSKRAVCLGNCLLGAILTLARPANSAGWDTPIVYTARQQGMGGTAIASVDDPSASYHNPAGYSGVQGLELFGNFSLLIGNLTTSPGEPNQNSKSNLILAPFPYLGAGFRLHEWVTLGIAAYPVASGAADYDYSLADAQVQDGLRAVFTEVSPGISLKVPKRILPGNLAIGAGYRMTYMSFERTRFTDSEAARSTELDIQTSGLDPKGFRLGLQYEPLANLKVGAVFRNKIKIETTAERGIANSLQFEDITFDFILPAQIGAGIRYDIDRYGVALDYQFTAQAQNSSTTLEGITRFEDQTPSIAINNIFRWQNGHTLRTGLEYRMPFQDAELPLRLGYIWDGRVGNPEYPTGFGTPPAATSSFTGGLGYKTRSWQVNMATSYRFGGATIASPSEAAQAECVFCSNSGDYKLRITGVYIDFSYEWDLGHRYGY